MPSKQATRRAAAKAKSNARGRPAPPNDNAKGAGKGRPSGAAPELQCACCAAGGCAHAARSALHDLRARFGHAIQVVADPGDQEAFLYTVGADPEFLVNAVPREHVQAVGGTLNFLVDRVKSGHPVRHGHTVSSDGALFVAVQLQGAELRQALADKCCACSPDARVMLLQPVVRQCECARGGAGANEYAVFGGEGHRLGES